MVVSNELSEELKKKEIVKAFESDPGFKVVSKKFEINHSSSQKKNLKVEEFQNVCQPILVRMSSQVNPEKLRLGTGTGNMTITKNTQVNHLIPGVN